MGLAKKYANIRDELIDILIILDEKTQELSAKISELDILILSN